MIEFRQKNFGVPFLAKAAGSLALDLAPTLIGGGIQNKAQAKMNKEQIESQERIQAQQNKQMAAQTKALNNLASAAKKNPGMAPALAQAGMSGQRSYSSKVILGKLRML